MVSKKLRATLALSSVMASFFFQHTVYAKGEGQYPVPPANPLPAPVVVIPQLNLAGLVQVLPPMLPPAHVRDIPGGRQRVDNPVAIQDGGRVLGRNGNDGQDGGGQRRGGGMGGAF